LGPVDKPRQAAFLALPRALYGPSMNTKEIPVRALQLGERIDVKGLEREDAF
jgi:hypothetical protein